MTLTKQDIDALVTNMASQNFNPTAAWDALRKALYLAAGLTAEGERKPERVRCWMYDDRSITSDMPNPAWGLGPTTPGWFVPDTLVSERDGAE